MTLRLLGGLDPTMGAGIARDLATALSIDAGLSWGPSPISATSLVSETVHRGALVAAITATTIQGAGLVPSTVAVHPIVVERVLLDAVNAPQVDGEDVESVMAPDVTKLGLVPDVLSPTIRGALRTLRAEERRRGGYARRIVVDPVLGASAGGDLGVSARVLASWLEWTDLVTPNLDEAVALLDALRSGETARPVDRGGPVSPPRVLEPSVLAVSLAEALAKPPERRDVWVLLKGGHASHTDRVVDVLASAAGVVAVFERPRQPGPEIRGTGCALATAIATRLHLGASLVEATGDAIAWLDETRRRATPATTLPSTLQTALDALIPGSVGVRTPPAEVGHAASLHLPVRDDVHDRVARVLRRIVIDASSTLA